MKKYAKQLIAVFLSAIMAVSVLPATVFALRADLTVENAAQLRQLADEVNGGNSYEGKTVVLAANIDLGSSEWTPIGTSKAPFKGTFDGGLHVISGLSVTSGSSIGLFGSVKAGAVKNLVVKGSVSGQSNAAGIVGELSDGTVENCRNDADVSGSLAVGGVVGYVNGACTVRGCANTGSVSGTTGYIGGVTGQHWRAGTVENCYNTGAVSGPATVGGISGGHKAASPTISSCANAGIVTDTAGYANAVEAIIGNCRGATISGCIYVKGTGTDSKAGAEEVDSLSADKLGDAFEDTDNGVKLKWEKNIVTDVPEETFSERTELSAKLASYIRSAIGSKKAEAGIDDTLLGDPSYSSGASSTATDWMALAMGRFGWCDSKGSYRYLYSDGTGYKDYLSAMESYIENTYAENDGILHKVKATEWHRAAVTVAALGGDPTAFGKYNGSAIDLIADGSYNCVVTRGPGAQGINGWIWGLIAMDAENTPEAADAKYSRETFITEILRMQLADGVGGNEYGGWVLGGYGSSSDVDITAMAIQALAPYYNDDTVYTYTNNSTGREVSKTVRMCVDEALDRLGAMQNENGGFVSWNTENLESIAQVVVALCSVGIDPASDSRFITDSGKTLLDAMLRFRLSNGGFCHTLDTGWNSMANDQATYALVSYWRFENRMRALYDMRTEFSSDTAVAIDAAEKAIGAANDPASADYKAQLKAALAAFRSVDESERRYVRNYSSLAKAIELVGGESALDNDSPYIVSISVTKTPDKTVYTEGEVFDTAGMTVSATYSDGTVKEITDYRIGKSGALTLSDSEIYVIYGILKASVAITVREIMPWSGEGTEESPYIINTAEELVAFADRVNSGKSTAGQFFALGGDIDLAQTAWMPAGRTPALRFNGTFDGRGYSIYNMHSTSSGLFAYTGSDAKIRSVCIASGEIGSSNLSFIGAVVGWSYGSDVTDCMNGASIICSGWSGGIVGTVREGGISTISGCVNTGSITARDSAAGGIVGHLSSGGNGANDVTVSNCYNLGDISAKDGAGGIVGSVQDGHTVINCYNSAKTVSDPTADFYGSGAIAAFLSNGSTLSNCIYNSDLSSRGVCNGTDTAEGKTSDEMKSLETVTKLGEGFKADRYSLTNGGYPLVYWQKTDDADKIDSVSALIDAIGTVSTDSADKINAARNAYDNLDENLKAYVANISALEEAEATLLAIQTLAEAKSAAVSQLESYKNKEDYRSEEQAALADIIKDGKAAINAAKDTEEVAAALKAAKEKADALKTDSLLGIEETAADVCEKISSIGKVTIDRRDAILSARSAYNALSDEAKELVDNYDVLEAAEKAFAEIEAAAKPADSDKDISGGKKDDDTKTPSGDTGKSENAKNPKTGDNLYIISIVIMAAAAMCTAIFTVRKKDGEKAE